MTSTNNPMVVGHALYFEFVRTTATHNYTTQLIITPEAEVSNGNTVPVCVYRRRLATGALRKQWAQIRATRLASAYAAAIPAGTVMSSLSTSDKNRIVTDSMLNSIDKVFESLAKNSYTLFKVPVSVEVVATDMDDIAAGKTPYKLLGRIWKARKALGFPTEYVAELRPHPATTVL